MKVFIEGKLTYIETVTKEMIQAKKWANSKKS